MVESVRLERLILEAIANVRRDEWVQEPIVGWRNRICALDAEANGLSHPALVEAIIALEKVDLITIRKFQGSNPIPVLYDRSKSHEEIYRSYYFTRGSFDLRLTHEGRKALDEPQPVRVLTSVGVAGVDKEPMPGKYDFHPEIKRVSEKLYQDGHYKQAALEAYIRVIREVKTRSGLNEDGDSLMNHAFGCDNRTPVIQFNSLQTDAERDEQKGIMFLFKGIVGLRNYKAHTNTLFDDSSRAHDYLALASLLMRVLEIATVKGP